MSPQTRTRRDGSVRPRRVGALQPGNLVWLVAVWLLLWGDVSPWLVTSGLLVAVGTCLVFPLPPLRLRMFVWPTGLAVLVGRLAVDMVRASAQVAWLALRPGPLPANAVIRVDLRSSSDLVLTMTAELISLVPGSAVVEARRSTHSLFVHVLAAGDAAGADRARRDVLAQEDRVLRAFAIRSEGGL